MTTKENKTGMLDILSKLGGNCCPNFFLTGKSYSSLEKKAMELASEIQKRKLIDFTGAKEGFSIIIPYFTEQKAAKDFVDRLAESISIARDCYYQYQGIVIMELEKEWSRRGVNNFLRTVFDFMKNQNELCFILLAVDDKRSNNLSTIYSELCSIDLWLPIEIESSSPQKCVEYIESTAKHSKIIMPPDVKETLLQMFQQRDETDISNEEAAESLIKHIMFKRLVNSNHNPEIDISEISYLNSSDKARYSSRIGFTLENR